MHIEFGERPRTSWRRSEVLGFDVDSSTEVIRVRMPELTGRYDIRSRCADIRIGGPWLKAVETALKIGVQLFGTMLQRCLCLHASAVERGGKAYVFAGRSEAGKTTAAQLSALVGGRILREEMPCVTLSAEGANRVQVAAMPVTEKNLYPIEAAGYPLTAVYWLVQAAENRVRELPYGEAVQRLAQVCSIGVRHRLLMEAALPLAAKVARAVPVRELHFQKSPSFWSAIEDHERGE